MIKQYKNSGYYVSDDGKIYSSHSGEGRMRELSQYMLPNGYMTVHLHKISKKPFYVHRLVAEMFIPNPQQKEQVNHKDFDKTNNSMRNLEWVTQEENCNHFRRESVEGSGATSGRHGKLYKGNALLGEFYSLQQAKSYVKEHYACSLSTIGDINVNYKNKLVFIRNKNSISVEQFWQNHESKTRQYLIDQAQLIKQTKGCACELYENDQFVARFNSIREANEYAHCCFKPSNNYECKNKRLIVCNKM